MKTIILNSMLMGALLTAGMTSSYATTNVPPAEKEAKNTKVSFDNVQYGDRLYIKDSKNNTIYSEKIKTDGTYAKLFDLSNLPENQYYFEVDKKRGITILPFDIASDNVILNDASSTEIAKPVLYYGNDIVYLTRDNDDTQSLNVEIYYEGRELVYDETIERDGDVLRKYDFSKSMRGNYLFYIHYNDRLYTEYVSVL